MDERAPGPCVLLVEDDARSRTALATLLGLNGWDVVVACDGADGLAQVRAGLEPDVILTDYMMPCLNGLAMIEEIRRASTLPSPPAMLISAADLSPALYTKADAFLSKPFALEDLMKALCDLISDDRFV